MQLWMTGFSLAIRMEVLSSSTPYLNAFMQLSKNYRYRTRGMVFFDPLS